MDDNKKKWIKRIILWVVNLALIVALANYRYHQIINRNITGHLSMAISDAFFVIGFFNLGFGALVKISMTGFFDIFAYSAKAILNFFIPRSVFQNDGDFYEYKVRKAEKRKETDFFRVMFWTGIGLMAIGLLLYFV